MYNYSVHLYTVKKWSLRGKFREWEIKAGLHLYAFLYQSPILTFYPSSYSNAVMHTYSSMKSITSFMQLVSFRGPAVSTCRCLLYLEEIILRQEKYTILVWIKTTFPSLKNTTTLSATQKLHFKILLLLSYSIAHEPYNLCSISIVSLFFWPFLDTCLKISLHWPPEPVGVTLWSKWPDIMTFQGPCVSLLTFS